MGAVSALRTFRATFVSNFKSQLRFYTFTGWMISSILSPLFLLASAWVIARFVAGGSATPPFFFALTGYPSYLSFAVLGLAFNALALSALDDGGSAVYDEESEGTWDLLALTPMSRFVWMFSKTLAGMTASLFDFAIVLAVGGLAFGLVVTPASLATAALGVALTLVGLQGFGFLMAALGLIWKQPHAMAVLLSPVLVFVSGMMFPVEALPRWVQWISYSFPLTHGLKVVRDALLLGRGLLDLTPVLLALLATGAAYAAVGYAAFRFMEKRALRRGVLGKY